MRRSAGMQKGRPSSRSRRPRRSPGWRREVLLKQMPREGACEPPRSADSQGQEDNLLKDALAPGKSVKVKAKGLKGCSFGIAADLEDGSSSEATGVNLCKDATVKLVD